MTPRMPDRRARVSASASIARAGDDDRAGRADVDVLGAQLAVGRSVKIPGGYPTSSGKGRAAEDRPWTWSGR
jgi:hypothetical protein